MGITIQGRLAETQSGPKTGRGRQHRDKERGGWDIHQFQEFHPITEQIGSTSLFCKRLRGGTVVVIHERSPEFTPWRSSGVSPIKRSSWRCLGHPKRPPTNRGDASTDHPQAVNIHGLRTFLRDPYLVHLEHQQNRFRRCAGAARHQPRLMVKRHPYVFAVPDRKAE